MNKKVGLALGSGASRGLAHIGVIKAFEENNIPIDCISGCSMGAAIGGMYASGTDIHFLPVFLKEINEKVDTLLIDPPRSGLVKNMVDDVLNVRAERIIYVSCNPISLSRDLKALNESYEIKKIYLLDMFSNTYHFESVVILQKR